MASVRKGKGATKKKSVYNPSVSNAASLILVLVVTFMRPLIIKTSLNAALQM